MKLKKLKVRLGIKYDKWRNRGLSAEIQKQWADLVNCKKV